MNAAGVPISWHAYWPFGGHRAGAALPTDRGYTGQQYEGGISDTNLYYYHARFYSPGLAHFDSADRIAGDGLNRYAYVRGNPIRYTDPSGHCAWVGIDCDPADALRFIRRAFYGTEACGGGDPAARNNMYALSLWAIRESTFLGSVTSLTNDWFGAWFVKQVKSIRRVESLGPRAYLRSSFWVVGVDYTEDGYGSKHPTLTVQADAVAGLVEYFIDYSFLDFRIGAEMTLWTGAGNSRHRWDETAINSNFLFPWPLAVSLNAIQFWQALSRVDSP